MANNDVITASELKFSQANKILHQIPITKPSVNESSKLIYIEDALNNDSREKFTYITKIKTDVGYNYYGVKRLPFFIYDSDNNYTAKEKNNINADVVILTPSSKQTQIYSFKNGAQYMELSSHALNLAKANGKILPHYIHSYEYIIDGEIPEEGNGNSYNLKYYGSIGYISNASSLSQLCQVSEIMPTLNSLLENALSTEDKLEIIDGFLTYSFSVPYSYKYSQQDTQDTGYVKIQKSPTITRIDKNIKNASQTSYIYECTFSKISDEDKQVLKSYTDVFDIYERKISYVMLDNKLVTTQDIVDNSGCGLENEYEGQNVFYTFDKKSSTYLPITTQKTNYSQQPIFAKEISYSKIATSLQSSYYRIQKSSVDDNEEAAATTTPSVSYYNYLQEYEYTEVDSKEKPSSKTLYYIPKQISETINAYYPIQAGIVSDGSIEYYGYTYVELTEDRLKDIIDLNDGGTPVPKVYIKQEYSKKEFGNLGLSDYDLDNLYTYEGNSIIYEESIGNTDYIFDLDVSGKTIYAKTKDIEQLNNEEEENNTVRLFSANNSENELSYEPSTKKSDITPISKEDIENIYFNKFGSDDDWASKNKKQETVTNKMFKYSLPANYAIGSTLDYNGKWKKIDIKSLKDTLKSDEEINEYLQELKDKLYVKEEGYNEIAITDIVIGYDVKFYVYEIGKIKSSDINFEENGSDYYVDATKYVNENTTDVVANSNPSLVLKAINKYGFITDENIKYYTREPIKAVSRDLYFFIDKDYYAKLSASQESEEVTITGTTPIIPLSMLSIDGVSLGDFKYDFGNDETVSSEKYIRVRNDLASMLVNSENFAIVSYKETENSLLQKVSSSSYPISYKSTYYVICSISNQNNSANQPSENSPTGYAITYLYSDSSYTFNWDEIQYYKDIISHYSLSYELENVNDVFSFDNKYLYSKYFYPEFTINNGIHKAKDGSYYTSISVFDGSRGTISKSLFLQPNIFNVTEYTYEYTAHAFIEVDSDANLNGVTENHYSDYYISMDDEITQLTPESKSPTYWQNYFANLSGNNKLYTYKDKVITAKYDGRSIGPRDNIQIQYFDNLTYEPKIINKDNILFGIIFNTDLTSTSPDDMIVDPYTNLFVSPISGINEYASYEYTVVHLKEEILNAEGQQDNVENWQENASYVKDVVVPEPFYLANEKTIEFTGTYHWNLPEHKYIFKEDNEGNHVAYDIMTNTGYWERDYAIKSIPLTVASYNFYIDPNEVSSTTASYNYIPDSKIVTAIITHPEISYNYIVRESKEITRFTYFYGGKECNYPSTSKVQVNDDGTYTGAITIEENGMPKTELVKLNKHIVVDISPTTKKIIHQKAHTTYEYSSYKTSIALTNEKKPVLYNTELVPASSHKVLYWNEDAESYAIRTVVDSFAYYAYNYWYETVPFVTDTYINQTKDFRVAYIKDLSYSMDNVAHSIDNAINGASGSLASAFSSIDNVATYLNEIKNTQTNVLPSLSTTIETAANTLSENLASFTQNIVNQSNNSSGSYINTYDIYSNIADQTSTIDRHSTYIETNIKDLSQAISSAIESSNNEMIESINNLFVDNNQSITYIINKALNKNSKPSYEEFMINLSKELYSKCDFDTDVIETEQKDENGNILSKTKHKPNPINLAKKSIYRADILWQELKKKNIV